MNIPEGATHLYGGAYYRLTDGVWFVWSIDDHWRESRLPEVLNRCAEALPVPPQAPCCAPTAEELAALAEGDCTPEELWGGSRPTCPKCIKADAQPVALPELLPRDDVGHPRHIFIADGFRAGMQWMRSAVEKLGPLYTHADAGEVERLREDVMGLSCIVDEMGKERDTLRAQLVRRNALLKQAGDFMYIMTGHDHGARLRHKYGDKWWGPIDELLGRICTALSASAEPKP